MPNRGLEQPSDSGKDGSARARCFRSALGRSTAPQRDSGTDTSDVSPPRLKSQTGRLARAVGSLLLAGCLVAPLAGAAKSPRTGFADDLYADSSEAVRGKWLDHSKRAGADLVRLNPAWADIATREPMAPRSALDLAYNWDSLDRAVESARGKGLDVLITVYNAPRFAEGGSRPNSAPAGTWKPKPGALGDFAHALAERYSGDTLNLPRVKYFQAWNEPNLSTYLTPQYSGKRNKSAGHYKRMQNAFYKGVKSAQRSSKVVTAGTAPYGDPAGGNRTRPLTFWRKVFCLKGGQRKLNPARCKNKPKLDILAHHPINTSGGPRRSAINANDASTPDFGQVRRILRAAERGGNITPRRGHSLWATELWWDTKPPSKHGVSLRTQARWLKDSLRLLARQGAKVVINLRIRDARVKNHNVTGSASGLYLPSGKAKPSLRAWRQGSR